MKSTNIPKYTRKKLEELSVSKLSGLYIVVFENLSDASSASYLEEIADVLFERKEVVEKVDTLNHIREMKKKAVYSEDYKKAAELRDMENYFQIHVMG